jgi:hypothetical protein
MRNIDMEDATDTEFLLDLYAGLALQGILANPETNRGWGVYDNARYAYLQAKAMMEVRGELK